MLRRLLVSFVLVLCTASGVQAMGTTVQTKPDFNASAGTTRQVQLDAAIRSGHGENLCAFWKGDISINITNVQDDLGNTLTAAASKLARPTDGWSQCFGKAGANGGQPTITVTWSSSVTDIYLLAFETLGSDSPTYFGTIASGTATSGTTLTSDPFTPTYTDSVIYAFAVWNDGTTATPGTVGGRNGLKASMETNAGLALQELSHKTSLGSNITASINTGSAGISKGSILVFEIKAATQTYASNITVGLSGRRFTLNGTQTFLVGPTYFDGINWWLSDLNAMQQYGHNTMRVLLDNYPVTVDDNDSLFSTDGSLREAQVARIHGLCLMADYRNMAVELVIHVADSSPNTATRLTTEVLREGVVTDSINTFKQHTNVYWDLINEFNYGVEYDQWTGSEAQGIYDTAIAANASGVYFISGAGGIPGTSFDWALVYNDDASVIGADLSAMLGSGLDTIAYHAGRQALDWFTRIETRSTNILNYLCGTLSRCDVGVYFNEEARVGSVDTSGGGTDPTAAQMISASGNCKNGGCMGYIMHTLASFDMRTQSMLQRFSANENTAFQSVASVAGPFAGGGGSTSSSSMGMMGVGH